MLPIVYGGRLAAVATARRVWLSPEVEALDRGHPELRFIVLMCLYARDVLTRELPGPYSSTRAELYARCVLIEDAAFERHRGESDAELAERFGVPVSQVAAKRGD